LGEKYVPENGKKTLLFMELGTYVFIFKFSLRKQLNAKISLCQNTLRLKEKHKGLYLAANTKFSIIYFILYGANREINQLMRCWQWFFLTDGPVHRSPKSNQQDCNELVADQTDMTKIV
jgi:hypothetical protein